MKFFFSALILLTGGVDMAQAGLPLHVSKIYSYECTKRFFEGEGVGPNGLSCVGGQNLGFYTASYQYYLYSTDQGNNFNQRGTVSYYANDICGLGPVDRYSCALGAPTLRFGLSALRTTEFSVGIQLNPNPQMPPVFMGYAATPVRGECAEGLVKIRAYNVSPPSFHNPLPSNFVNINHRLDSFVAATDEEMVGSFKVIRIPSELPCDVRGICSWPSGESYTAWEMPYEETGAPSYCVVPADSVK